MPVPAEDPARARRLKLFKLCDEVAFSRDERLELATYLLRRDVETYSDLNDAEVSRLLDAIEGFGLVSHLLSVRS
jgi:hypothetical protein